MCRKRPFRDAAGLLFCAVTCCASFASAQDLLPDIEFSDIHLDLSRYVRLPTGQRNINSMTTRSGDERLYVTATEGKVFVINTGNGTPTATEWFNVRASINATTGRDLNFDNGQAGLRSLAFHPEFDINGKFYTTQMENRPSDTSGHNYLGVSTSNTSADSVLVEWTYDHQMGRVVGDSYRELFRINIPVYDHPIKQIKFDQFAAPGDEDYGLLYISHGDASVQAAQVGGQSRQDALGKILRIDPLQDGDLRYTTPNNPFVDDDDTLNEIYALGFRNPHNFSFALDSDGESQLIVADIGRANVEEVNLVVAGANHGWSEREGTFVQLKDVGGYFQGVEPLPGDEAENGYTFPVAQFDHTFEPGGIAIVGGHVIANGSDPDLQGQYIFGDFPISGRIFHASFDQMLNAVTLLDPNDPNRDEPTELTQAEIFQLRLAFDHDDDPNTAPQVLDDFGDILPNRLDLRFGEGSRGELYISSKRNGQIYLATRTWIDPVLGDTDFDGDVDSADRTTLVTHWTGALMPGVGERTRGDGDFDGDGDVDSADLTTLTANWTGAEQAIAAIDVVRIPEPTAAVLLLGGMGLSCLRRRRAKLPVESAVNGDVRWPSKAVDFSVSPWKAIVRVFQGA